MAHYNLQRYMYDCFRLDLLRKELNELMNNYGGCRWSGARVASLVAEITSLQSDVARYENLPQNRADDDA